MQLTTQGDGPLTTQGDGSFVSFLPPDYAEINGTQI